MRQPLGPIGGNRTPCQIREKCPLFNSRLSARVQIPFASLFPTRPFLACPKGRGGAGFPRIACAIRRYPDYTRSRDFPSNFLSHGSLPPRSCFRRAPRALTPSGQKLRFWLICLTAVGSFVLQVWDSASSRLLADFHRSTHIASVVPGKLLSIFMERSFLN